MGMKLCEFVAGNAPTSLPLPIFSIVDGGRKGSRQDCTYGKIIVPYAEKTNAEAVEMGTTINKKLKSVLSEYLQSPETPGASGGYAAQSEDPAVAISLMANAVEECGYKGKVLFNRNGS